MRLVFDPVDAQGRYHVPDTEVLELAESIADAFIEQRPKYIPGRVSIPRRDHVKFYQAARLCRQQRLTAEQFVAQQLKGMALTSQFWASSIAKQFDTHQGLGLVDVNHYMSQLAIYNARRMLCPPRLLLEDDCGPFTPLFRLAMAYEIEHHELVKRLRQQASTEFKATKLAPELFPHLKGMFHD